MAETTQELVRLNKNVEEAVKLLRASMGNAAQANATNEKQREAINKWFMTTEMSQTNLQKNEELIDEEKKLLKQEEDQSKKFFGMATSISDGFKNAFVQVGSTIKTISMNILSSVRNIFSQLQSQFLSLFGEESEWFGVLGAIKDSMTGIFSWITSGLLLFFRRTPTHARKGLKLLESIVNMMRVERKMEALEGGKKVRKGGIFGLIAGIVGSIISAIGSLLTGAGGLLSFPALAKGLRLLKLGIGKIFLPIQLVLSAIDFIKGYMGTEGTFLDRVIGGYKEAVQGFYGIFLDAMGWIIEKTASLFGIEMEGTGSWLREQASRLTEFLVKDSIFGKIQKFNDLNERYKEIYGVGYFENLGNKLREGLNWLGTTIAELWNGIVDWISGPTVQRLAKAFGVKLPERIDLPAEAETSPMDTVTEHERRRLRERQRLHQEQIDIAKEGTEANKESARKADTSLQSIAAMQQTNGGGQTIIREPKQVPDESDNMVLGIKNLAMEMD